MLTSTTIYKTLTTRRAKLKNTDNRQQTTFRNDMKQCAQFLTELTATSDPLSFNNTGYTVMYTMILLLFRLPNRPSSLSSSMMVANNLELIVLSTYYM